MKMIVSLAKGIELETHLRPSQVIAEVLPGRVAGALTGPTNAGEVARLAGGDGVGVDGADGMLGRGANGDQRTDAAGLHQ